MKSLVATAVAILGLAPAACGGGGRAADIASVGGPSTTAAAATAPTTMLSPTSTRAAGPSAPAVTSTTLRRPTTTRVPATAIVAATTTTGPPPAAPRCEDVPFTVEVTTERTTYRPGEIVKGTFTMRNTSGAACVYRNVAFTQGFEDASGRAVGFAGAGHTDGFVDSAVAAGATITRFNLDWDQRICPDAVTCTQAPPGTYVAKVTFTMSGTQRPGSATFRLVAA